MLGYKPTQSRVTTLGHGSRQVTVLGCKTTQSQLITLGRESSPHRVVILVIESVKGRGICWVMSKILTSSPQSSQLSAHAPPMLLPWLLELLYSDLSAPPPLPPHDHSSLLIHSFMDGVWGIFRAQLLQIRLCEHLSS